MTLPVLIIEDDLSLAQALTLSLETVGLPVEYCTTAETAITLLGARRYGCIVLDLILESGLSGMYVINAARSLAPDERPMIVMITGASVEQLRGVSHDLVKAILLKPLDLELFAQYVLATYRRGLDLKSAAGAVTDVPPLRAFCGACGTEMPSWIAGHDNIFDQWADTPCTNCGRTPRGIAPPQQRLAGSG
jgi:DNA-binding response OmpR family regulator